jgi:hypothetical protein
MDRDYVVGQWRRKRLAGVPSRAEFPGRENGNPDDCQSAVHDYSVGRRRTVTRAVTRAPGAPGAPRVPGATHSPATAANNAGVHIQRKRAVFLVPVWRGRGRTDIGVGSRRLRMDCAEQRVVDHDYIRRERQRQRHSNVQCRREQQWPRAYRRYHGCFDDGDGDAAARSSHLPLHAESQWRRFRLHGRHALDERGHRQ